MAASKHGLLATRVPAERTNGTGPSPAVADVGTAVPNGHRDPTPAAPVVLFDIRAVADPTAAARAARAAFAAEGRALSRDALAERMREDGHAVSNARASLLLKILRGTPETVDPCGSETDQAG